MISVVIPTLNEAERLPPLIESLRSENPACEIIVADGGSRDGTLELAARHGVKFVLSEPGRGHQLRAGATEAAGDILFFLHADCLIREGAVARIDKTLASEPELVGGNFRLVFDGDDRFSRWLDGFYAWIRSRGLYYGDSGIFVRRRVYEALGGFKPIALMEDYEFIRGLERMGPTCCIEDPPLVTSSRRFQARNPVAIVLGWLLIHGLYYLGVPPEILARLYDSARLGRRSRTQGKAASFKAQS